MKELYLALATIALVMIILSMSVEISYSGAKTKTKTTKKVNNSNIDINDLGDDFPNRIYNNSNLNNVFLRKYYSNNNSKFSPEKNFYLPN